VRDVPYNTV